MHTTTSTYQVHPYEFGGEFSSWAIALNGVVVNAAATEDSAAGFAARWQTEQAQVLDGHREHAATMTRMRARRAAEWKAGNHECGPRATPAQVEYICDMLTQRGGYLPTWGQLVERVDIELMCVHEASATINSLKGSRR